MKTLLIIAFIAVILIVLKAKAYVSGKRFGKNTSRPADAKKPAEEKPNDKTIIVSNVQHEDIKHVLITFFNIYNQQRFDALPRLWQLSPGSFAVTFPYDIDFITYCFIVNFLKYPFGIKWEARVNAWATTKTGDDWITARSVNKHVMLFFGRGR